MRYASFDEQWGAHVQRVINEGERVIDRTGVGTRKLFGVDMRFDLAEQFPAITWKRLSFKSALGELFWIYVDQSNDVGLLRDKYGSTVWDEWERADGTIGHAYGYIVRKYAQIDKLIRGLREMPHGRRHIISLWDIDELPNMALHPCAFQTIWTVANGRLNCQLVQRSGDSALGVPFNTAQYAVLVHMVAGAVGLQPGVLWHTITDFHIYENHVEPIKRMFSERQPVKVAPKLVLPDVDDFYSYDVSQIYLEGYASNPSIKLEVAV